MADATLSLDATASADGTSDVHLGLWQISQDRMFLFLTFRA